MSVTETSIETPCIRVCALHPQLRLCTGCGRSIEEIAGWISFDGRERARIMARLPLRLSAMAGASLIRATT